MNLVLVGLSHKTAPVEVRERVTIPEKRVHEVSRRLGEEYGLDCNLILSTCNRTEVLAQSSDPPGASRCIRDFFHCDLARGAKHLDQYLYSFDGEQAVRHIFRVASSLDSMVVGESQILGQLKHAYALAREKGSLGRALEGLVPHAFFVAKRVRSETSIGSSAVSVSSVAVELALKIFGDLCGKSVLLVGAGHMAELAAANLIRAGISGVYVANRTPESSQKLAARLKGEAVSFEAIDNQLIHADVVLISTGAPDYVIVRARIEKAMRARKHRPIFLIDISVPRNVDPEVNEIENAFLFDIDSLQEVAELNLNSRRRSAVEAEQIVEQEVGKYVHRHAVQQLGPLVQALRTRFEQICLQDFQSTAIGLDDTQKARVRKHMSQAAHRLAHPLIMEIKRCADEQADGREIDLIMRLFQLDKSK